MPGVMGRSPLGAFYRSALGVFGVLEEVTGGYRYYARLGGLSGSFAGTIKAYHESNYYWQTVDYSYEGDWERGTTWNFATPDLRYVESHLGHIFTYYNSQHPIQSYVAAEDMDIARPYLPSDGMPGIELGHTFQSPMDAAAAHFPTPTPRNYCIQSFNFATSMLCVAIWDAFFDRELHANVFISSYDPETKVITAKVVLALLTTQRAIHYFNDAISLYYVWQVQNWSGLIGEPMTMTSSTDVVLEGGTGWTKDVTAFSLGLESLVLDLAPPKPKLTSQLVQDAETWTITLSAPKGCKIATHDDEAGLTYHDSRNVTLTGEWSDDGRTNRYSPVYRAYAYVPAPNGIALDVMLSAGLLAYAVKYD